MSWRWSQKVLILLVMAAATVTVACGGAGGAAMLEVPEIGFSMKAPGGWKLSRQSRDLCSKGDGTGMVLVEPYHAGFEAHVDQVSREFGSRVLSRTSTLAGGRPAVEVISAQDQRSVRALRLFIDLGGRAVTVSFVVPEPDFAAEEPAIREALETITLD